MDMKPNLQSDSRPDRDAAAYAEAEVGIAAPPERVWQLLTRIDRWSEWNALVERAKLDGQLEPGSLFHWKSKGLTVTSTLRDVVPCRRLAWTGKALGTRAIHTWELAATPSGTLLRTAESFSGWLPKLMPRAMQRTLEETLPAWLQAVRSEAEREGTSWRAPGE
ncbi:MAG TPA: SRPBCC family protein [Steroidobacteraceae bacterium]|nr:SRPBCC family protein [Steroidobacteraceae bacterium]